MIDPKRLDVRFQPCPARPDDQHHELTTVEVERPGFGTWPETRCAFCHRLWGDLDEERRAELGLLDKGDDPAPADGSRAAEEDLQGDPAS